MPETRDVRSVIEAAEQAAGAGDYASAREHLLRAIALQEARVGPTHPDLANALNNLGVVYEREGKLAEAEACYRRAYAIASAALEPHHPFVVTSAKNLQEFCEARGRPFDAPAGWPAALTSPASAVSHAPPLAKAEVAGPASFPRTTVDRPPESAARAAAATERAEPGAPPAARAQPMALLVLAGLITGALIVVGLIAMQSRGNRAPRPPAVTAPAQFDRPKPVAGARTAPPPADTRNRMPRAAAAEAPAEAARPSGSAPTLAAAELCRTLRTGGDWRCTPATGTLQPGLVFFYTRLLSQTDTTVEHRWYRGARLHQAITLRVHANRGAGYRTYSQLTVSPARAGNWRVELRTADGAVLDEKRFTVADR